MELDPKWLKPGEERPRRRGLIGALRKETNLKCLILTCLIYGCVLAIVWCRVTRVTKVDIDYNAFPITRYAPITRQISPCDDGYIYIPSAFVVMLYLLYLIECWHCKAWVQLRFEKTDVNRAYLILKEMKQAQPMVWWKAVCYHYVRRTRETARIHNGDSYPATQVYYERVNSHLAAGCFYFGYCGVRDISPELVDLEKYAATKIRLSKGFIFANLAAAQEFEEQRASFFQEQERHDDYLEMKEGLDLSTSSSSGDFKENVISWANPDNLPWYGRSTVFWTCNFLLLSWPLRLILELNTAHVHYQVNKLFGSNYVTPMSPLTDLISSGNYTSRNQNQRRNRAHQIRSPQPSHLQLQRRHRNPRQNQNQTHHHRVNTAQPLVQLEPSDLENSEIQPLLLNSTNSEKPEKDISAEKDLNTRNAMAGDTDIGFPSYFHFRNSNRNPLSALFSSSRSRNSRLARGPRIPRSVTLLMTKGERREFSRFGFNYFDDIISQAGDDEEGIFVHEDSRNSSSINNSNSNSSGLAPTYSQALLLMEPMNTNSIRISRTEVDSRTRNRDRDSGDCIIYHNTTRRGFSDNINNSIQYEDDVASRSTSLPSDNPNNPTATTATTSRPNEEAGILVQNEEGPGMNAREEGSGRLRVENLMMVTEAGDESRERANRLENPPENARSGDCGNLANFSHREGGPLGHYRRSDSANSIRNSSLVLNTLAPRTMTGVPIDLTQPVVLTVPNDPRSSTRGSHISRSSDSPPSYEEALRTSRPVFLPTWARIRRCFTERDIHSRLSSSNFWVNSQDDLSKDEEDDNDYGNEHNDDSPTETTSQV